MAPPYECKLQIFTDGSNLGCSTSKIPVGVYRMFNLSITLSFSSFPLSRDYRREKDARDDSWRQEPAPTVLIKNVPDEITESDVSL